MPRKHKTYLKSKIIILLKEADSPPRGSWGPLSELKIYHSVLIEVFKKVKVKKSRGDLCILEGTRPKNNHKPLMDLYKEFQCKGDLYRLCKILSYTQSSIQLLQMGLKPFNS